MALTQPPPPAPGEVLRDLLAERGISQSNAAQALRMSRGHLNSIINGHNPFSADLKLKLQDFLGLPPSHWSQVQETHNQFAATVEGRAHLQKKSTQSLLEQWELRGPRVLVDHEIEAAAEAGYLGLGDFDAERLGSTFYPLSLDLQALVMRLSDGRGIEATRSLKPSLKVGTGEVATIRTAEKLRLPDRVRGLIVSAADGLGGPMAPVWFDPLIPPGFEGSINVQIENRSPHPLVLEAGRWVVFVEFTFLADAPVRLPVPPLMPIAHD